MNVVSRGGSFVMNKVDTAVELFRSGLNCSQAMLTVFGEPHGLDSTTASKLGRPLGGGMGRLARTCGALTGAMLILGLSVEREEEKESRTATAHAVQELMRRFEARHGTSECRVLLGADMTTGDGMNKIQEEKLISTVCPTFVRDAAQILEELLGAS